MSLSPSLGLEEEGKPHPVAGGRRCPPLVIYPSLSQPRLSFVSCFVPAPWPTPWGRGKEQPLHPPASPAVRSLPTVPCVSFLSFFEEGVSVFACFHQFLLFLIAVYLLALLFLVILYFSESVPLTPVDRRPAVL